MKLLFLLVLIASIVAVSFLTAPARQTKLEATK